MWQFVTIKMGLRNSTIITNFSSRHIVLKEIPSDQKLRLILAAVRVPGFSGGLHNLPGENKWLSLPGNPSSFLIYSQPGKQADFGAAWGTY